MNVRWPVLPAIAALLTCLTQSVCAEVYFIVGEVGNGLIDRSKGSYVVKITNPDDIAHARAIIAQGDAFIGARIVSCAIRAGADGINRDYLYGETPEWNWHVTEFIGFSEFTIEILDAWPVYVASDVDEWIRITRGFNGDPSIGYIGFWGYTVVAELPVEPRVEEVAMIEEQVVLKLKRLSVDHEVEIFVADTLESGGWTPQQIFLADHPTKSVQIPLSENAVQQFYRVEVRRKPDAEELED